MQVEALFHSSQGPIVQLPPPGQMPLGGPLQLAPSASVSMPAANGGGGGGGGMQMTSSLVADLGGVSCLSDKRLAANLNCCTSCAGSHHIHPECIATVSVSLHILWLHVQMLFELQDPPSGTGEQLYADVDEAMMAAGLLEPMQVCVIASFGLCTLRCQACWADLLCSRSRHIHNIDDHHGHGLECAVLHMYALVAGGNIA